ncbi:MAG: hypothetical protein DWH96_07020 [Planctomycetota bacterium]|nr:MAG: hypothetical protein DWH96_07020 [Planctomycetota bacterium]
MQRSACIPLKCPSYTAMVEVEVAKKTDNIIGLLDWCAGKGICGSGFVLQSCRALSRGDHSRFLQ